jgi:hypothetical protein
MSPETTDLLACTEKARAEAAALRGEAADICREAARTLMRSREIMGHLKAELRQPCPEVSRFRT